MIKYTSTKAATTGGTEMRLTAGAATGFSSFRKDETNIDVLAGGAFSTTEASRTPRTMMLAMKTMTMKTLHSMTPLK
jgi:hypothetical protein